VGFRSHHEILSSPNVNQSSLHYLSVYDTDVFNSACDSRIYEYLLPSYCLLPSASSDPLAKQMDASSPGWRATLGASAEFADAAPALTIEADGEGGRMDVDVEADPKRKGEYERRRGWRVDEATMKRFRDLIAEFSGTQWVDRSLSH